MKIIKITIYIYIFLLNVLNIYSASRQSVSKLRQYYEQKGTAEIRKVPSKTQGAKTSPAQDVPGDAGPAAKAEIKKEIKVPVYNPAATNQLFYSLDKNNELLAGQALRNGADPNAYNEWKGVGRTALKWAISNSNGKLVKLLLDWGANPNAIEKSLKLTGGHLADRVTPLEWAFLDGKIAIQEIVKLLLMYGASPKEFLELYKRFKEYEELDKAQRDVSQLWQQHILYQGFPSLKEAYEGYSDYLKWKQEAMEEASNVSQLALMPPGVFKVGIIESYL